MKITVAGFQHETNSFCPLATTKGDFILEDGWPGLTEGEKIFETFSNANLPLGGCLQFACDSIEVVPILWASAEPAGLVQDEAFDWITGKILDGIEASLPTDGIYLDLHGAMITDSHEDGEGEILRLLRNRIGHEIPVAVSLDLHANVTPEMAELADVITIYRTYPHIDMDQTGFRAGELLREMIIRKEKPHMEFRKLPFIMPLHTQCTNFEPARSLYQLLPESNSLQNGTADIALGFPPSDIYQCGPAIVAYGFDSAETKRIADHIEDYFLQVESEFTGIVHSAQDAIRIGSSEYRPGKPVILADIRDVSGAGSTSDTTGVLAELVKAGVESTVVAALCDKQAVDMAHRVGVGGEFDFVLGGKLGGPEYPGYAARYKVTALSDGRFYYHGKMMEGVEAKIGPTAALQVVNSEVQIVVTGSRIQCLDQAVISHLGINLLEQKYLAIKSTVHFRADFEPIASEILLVDSPGCTPCRLNSWPLQNLRSGVRLL